MADWQEYVRRRLQSLDVSGDREEEIRAELAEHLEDAYEGALQRGAPPEAAAAKAKECVPNWQDLATEIRCAQPEGDMNDRVKRVWAPGAVAALLAHGLWTALSAAGLEPLIVWDDWHPMLFLFLPWLLMLPLVGAGAASWSRRCGGGRRDLLLAGLLPVLAVAVFLVLPSIAAFATDPQISAAFKFKVMLWRGYFGMVLLPGALLGLGVLPFLRQREAAAA